MSFLKQEVTLPKLRAPKLSVPRRGGGSARRRPAAARRSAGIIGLELGATRAIAAQAALRDGRLVADRLVARPLPSGLMQDGLVTDPDGLAAELRALFAEHKLPKRVRVGLATPRTILRVIDLPPLDEKDVRLALPLHAQERIPMPLDTAVLDHQTVGLVDTPEGTRLRVIVVATERAGVETLVETLRAAGLRPEGVDLSVFAAMRALSGAVSDPGPVLYAQLGDLVNVAIAQSGICHFTRQAPQGLSHVLGRIVDRRGGSLEEAQGLLAAVGANDADGASRAEMADVGNVLSRVAAEIGSELRASAEFYSNQAGEVVERGFVTGALAPLTGFIEALSEASGLRLSGGEANLSDAAASGGVDARIAPVAVGLTTERIVA